MSVILTILKIAGFIILILLALATVLVLMLLFIPIRYKGELDYDSAFAGKADASWMLGIIKFKAEYISSVLCYNIYIFGIKVYSYGEAENGCS